jgi:DEAD/DEAH box helicase domain-containing protein
MTDIMALDIETSNYSWEIGGWENKSLFDVSVVATWDGKDAHIFTKQDVLIDGVVTHDLHPRILGDHITAHVEKGGKILGHNIINFDFPVLKQSLDCWAVGDIMQKSDNVLDTKRMFKKASLSHGNIETSLQSLVNYTLGKSKSMKSVDAPKAWAASKYTEVCDYCVKDAQLTYDIYQHGKEHGMLKSRSFETGKIIEVEVEW